MQSGNSGIRIIKLPRIEDSRGNLTFIEEENHIPFPIKRVYWIYDVPGGEIRGSHAFRETDEFIVSLSGSFDVVLHNGKELQKIQLNRSYMGLFIPKLTWRKLENFSTNSLAMILASTTFSTLDYIRDYDEFIGIMYQQTS